MRAAAIRISQSFPILAASSLYETAPVGYQNQPSFLNAVLEIESPADPGELHREILNIETDLGRRRTFVNAPRTIDIDILLIGDIVVQTRDLTIPHPRMQQRAFVLVPLAEIAGNRIHPTLQRSIGDLLGDLGDVSRDVVPVEGPEWVKGTGQG